MEALRGYPADAGPMLEIVQQPVVTSQNFEASLRPDKAIPANQNEFEPVLTLSPLLTSELEMLYARKTPAPVHNEKAREELILAGAIDEANRMGLAEEGRFWYSYPGATAMLASPPFSNGSHDSLNHNLGEAIAKGQILLALGHTHLQGPPTKEAAKFFHDGPDENLAFSYDDLAVLTASAYDGEHHALKAQFLLGRGKQLLAHITKDTPLWNENEIKTYFVDCENMAAKEGAGDRERLEQEADTARHRALARWGRMAYEGKTIVSLQEVRQRHIILDQDQEALRVTQSNTKEDALRFLAEDREFQEATRRYFELLTHIDRTLSVKWRDGLHVVLFESYDLSNFKLPA
jgi:hypothetical protein